MEKENYWIRDSIVCERIKIEYYTVNKKSSIVRKLIKGGLIKFSHVDEYIREKPGAWKVKIGGD